MKTAPTARSTAESMAEANDERPLISVVIPTYERAAELSRLLDSLEHQTLPAERFEVVVVDDGSRDETSTVAAETRAIEVCCVRQANSGDAVARNTGAKSSRGEILVFLDDDIVVGDGYLASMADALAEPSEGDVTQLIVVAELVPRLLDEGGAIFAPAGRDSADESDTTVTEVAFTDCFSGAMAIRCDAYEALGGMYPLNLSGSNVWCDVEFAWRAYRSGYRFFKVPGAIAYHFDRAHGDRELSIMRSQRCARAAAQLFQRHPALCEHLPMFEDKLPIDLRRDRPALVLKKVARATASTRASIAALRLGVRLLDKARPRSAGLGALERWLIGAHLYRGLRVGLRDVAASEFDGDSV